MDNSGEPQLADLGLAGLAGAAPPARRLSWPSPGRPQAVRGRRLVADDGKR
jgi:hypothetical protein